MPSMYDVDLVEEILRQVLRSVQTISVCSVDIDELDQVVRRMLLGLKGR